jgi:quercetin dioxygenase-like cupin family protein
MAFNVPNRPTAVVTIDPEHGESLSVVGDTYRILTSGKETNRAFAIIDMLIPPKGGPGPHAHAAIEETFFVVEGEVVVRSESQTYTAGKGAFVRIPRGGAIHSFTNESGTMAHLLCVVVPAGLEEMFEEIGQPIQAATFLPPPPMTPDAQKKMQAVAEKYGQEIFPPDYLKK